MLDGGAVHGCALKWFPAPIAWLNNKRCLVCCSKAACHLSHISKNVVFSFWAEAYTVRSEVSSHGIRILKMDWTQISIKDLVVSIQTKMISKFPCRYWKTSWQLFDIQKIMFFTSESTNVVNRVIGWAGGWRLSSLLSQAWRIEMALTKPSHFTSWKCVYV